MSNEIMLINREGDPIIPMRDLKTEGGVFALYFSASWCRPCHAFTALLREAVNGIRQEYDPSFNVVFASLDSDQESMRKYFQNQHGDWLAIPHREQNYIMAIQDKYEIQTIPTLLIFSNQGVLVSKTGKQDIERDGWSAAYQGWLQQVEHN